MPFGWAGKAPIPNKTLELTASTKLQLGNSFTKPLQRNAASGKSKRYGSWLNKKVFSKSDRSVQNNANAWPLHSLLNQIGKTKRP